MSARAKFIISGIFLGAAIVALGILNYAGFLAIEDQQEESWAREVSSRELFDLVYGIQVDFKIQVQEWKNVLLRGHSREDLLTYYAQFEDREARVKRGVVALLSHPKLSAELSDRVGRFQKRHEEIGKAYREALASGSLSSAEDLFHIDDEVRGIDRPPMEMLELLVRDIRADLARTEAQAREEMVVTVKTFTGLSALCLLVAIGLVLYFFIDRKRHEANLNEALNRAAKANATKSQFLAHMSHEIRTPMNGIVAAIDLLNEYELPPEGREVLKVIQTSSESLTVIVNDILDFSRIEAGKLRLRKEALELNGFLHILERSLLPMTQNKSLKLSFDWPREENLILTTDPVRLRQVLLNLLMNAIKFTDEGEVRLEVDMMQSSETAVKVEFRITDTGIGIPEEKREALFQAFSQVDTSLSRMHQGAGLGLVITQAIVSAMSGEVTFDSRSGRGTTFYVRITFPRSDPSELKHQRVGDVHFSSIKPVLNSVLVVDDVPTNLLVTKRLLGKFNLNVDLAQSGAEAIDRCSDKRYDLILMDCQMPRMDGYEASSRIHKMYQASGREPVIVALTAHAMDEHRRESIERGMREHLSKPLRSHELRECLLQFFTLPDEESPTA